MELERETVTDEQRGTGLKMLDIRHIAAIATEKPKASDSEFFVETQAVGLSVSSTKTKEAVEKERDEVRCEVCQKEAAKYKCPRCFKRTCCLACVKYHKEQDSCSGERNKAAYIALEDFTETHLVSDIQFLEDCDRQASSLKRSFRKVRTNVTERLGVLQSNAQQQGIFLKLMPITFSRHKENTSMYHYKSRLIKWHVEWVFPSEGLAFKQNDFLEEEPLQNGVEYNVREYLRRSVHSRSCTYLKPTPEGQVSLMLQGGDKLGDSEATCTVCAKMNLYLEKGGRRYHVYFKVNGIEANRERYYELNKDSSLKECLQHKLVIEFPTVFIVPESVSDAKFITLTNEEERVLGEKLSTMGFCRPRSKRWHPGQRRYGRHRPYNKTSNAEFTSAH